MYTATVCIATLAQSARCVAHSGISALNYPQTTESYPLTLKDYGLTPKSYGLTPKSYGLTAKTQVAV